MTLLDALKDIKSFVKDQIDLQKILLQAENGEGYVKPYVEICFFPHKNFTPGAFQSPGILVSVDNATDDAKDHTATVRLLCSTFGGGYYKDSDGLQTDIPDGSGYLDLINLMERLETALAAEAAVGRCTVRKPIELGIYDTEPSWPYWYGFLQFYIDLPANEYLISKETEEFLHGI